MSYKTIFFIAIIAVTVPHGLIAQEEDGLPQQGYSVNTLRNPIFEPAQVIVETMALNNWLVSNVQRLSYEEMKGPREHLYYLIDSRVKQIYAEERRILPIGDDPILEILFSWSEYLGVYGGAHAYNAIKSSQAREKVPAMELPAGINLSLNGDMFNVQSSLGWRVTFPYYFMALNIGDAIATNGPRTQILVVSTGAARDKSQLGHSQATLMFLFSPGHDTEAFHAYWRKQLNMGSEATTRPLEARGLQAEHAIDEETKMHKEFTSWSGPAGSYAVAYLGIEGTYEWNRQHFLDFLSSIEPH